MGTVLSVALRNENLKVEKTQITDCIAKSEH